MHLHKHIQSQDSLPVHELSCYLRAFPVHLALTVGELGNSGALPGPAAVRSKGFPAPSTGDRGGPHRPVTTDKVHQRTSFTDRQGYDSKRDRGNLSKPSSTKEHCQNCQGGAQELDYFCKIYQKT